MDSTAVRPASARGVSPLGASSLRRLVPRAARVRLSRLLGRWDSLSARRALARVARSGRPIVAGPWLGEVGFEILYWIPFLAWAVRRFDLDPARIVAVSRGGPEAWYRHVSGRYTDVFDFLSVDEFRGRNEARRAAAGEQKQAIPADLDAQIVGAVCSTLGIERADVLHPSMMYTVFRRYWWGHAPMGWVHRHARFRALARPPSSLVSAGTLPDEYIAVKFYFNDCFPPTPENQAFVADTLRALSRTLPVVSLDTGLTVDEHRGVDGTPGEGAKGIQPLVRPRNNLEIQSAVVAGARAFVGTYGGFSYLAPFYGVPSIGVYSRADGFSRAHLQMALSACASLPGASLRAMDVTDARPDQIATLLAPSW